MRAWRSNMTTSILRLRTLTSVSLALVVILGTSQSQGQITTATLSGNVTDASQAVLPGADVTVTNVNTGISSKTVTDATGKYIFPRLSPGLYTITTEKVGFKSTVISGIQLLVNQQANIDVQLQIG